jgi:ribosomal protein L21E
VKAIFSGGKRLFQKLKFWNSLNRKRIKRLQEALKLFKEGNKVVIYKV